MLGRHLVDARSEGQMRTCTCCNESKPESEFYFRAKRGRYEARCKSCFRAKVKTYADANREEVRDRNKLAGAKFREANRESERKRLREYVAANKELYAARSKVWRETKPHLNAAKEAKRRASKARATPSWANLTAIKAIYEEAAQLTERTGVLMHVDHIVPLMGGSVCGLHCEANLRVVPAVDNLRKGNHLIDALLH